MRIWSIHPACLDSKGLVALWRETLLAQNVLLGKTKGYKNHPQLDRFKIQKDPVGAIGFYLSGVCNEADKRGYKFDRNKIISNPENISLITVTKGQVDYEFEHLKRKLLTRDPEKYKTIQSIINPDIHSLFKIIDGEIEHWEKL